MTYFKAFFVLVKILAPTFTLGDLFPPYGHVYCQLQTVAFSGLLVIGKWVTTVECDCHKLLLHLMKKTVGGRECQQGS